MSGPLAETAPLKGLAPLAGLRWPMRLRVDEEGVRLVCGWVVCEVPILELSPREIESFPLDAATLAELANDHARECARFE